MRGGVNNTAAVWADTAGARPLPPLFWLPGGTMTTAAQTKFCAEKIESLDGLYIWVDGNGKITAGRGSLLAPKSNAFSLVQIETCPMRTPSCERGCYVHNLEREAPNTHALYRHNTDTIRRALDFMPEGEVSLKGERLANALIGWITENCSGQDFRWHVSGDVFSASYAAWVRGVVADTPDVRHWIYTRSFHLTDPLLRLPNLELNLSADRDNLWLARRYHAQTGKRICYFASGDEASGSELDNNELLARLESLPDGSVIFPDYPLRGKGPGSLWEMLGTEGHRERKMLCPVDAFGKSETNRCGPCRRCMVAV